jgi:hypothetical protein
MFRQTTALALRLRNTTRAPLTTSKPFNFEAVKARNPHWEPALTFEDLTPNPRQKNEGGERGKEMSWMTTYSAFDPGFTRPVPLMCRPPITLPSFRSYTKEVVEDKKDVKEKAKPWSYTLPKALRPKNGTTFSMINSSSSTKLSSQGVNVLQALLYGVPEPEKFSYAHEVVAPGSLVHKVLYGVKEMDDGEKVVATAKVTVPRAGEENAEGESRTVVRGQEVSVGVGVEGVLEREGGAGMVAK